MKTNCFYSCLQLITYMWGTETSFTIDHFHNCAMRSINLVQYEKQFMVHKLQHLIKRNNYCCLKDGRIRFFAHSRIGQWILRLKIKYNSYNKAYYEKIEMWDLILKRSLFFIQLTPQSQLGHGNRNRLKYCLSSPHEKVVHSFSLTRFTFAP